MSASTESEASARQMIADFLQEVTAHPASDHHRQEGRYPIGAPILLGVMVGDPPTFTPVYRGWVTDISPHGLSFLTEQDLPTDAQLVVNLDSLLRQPCLIPIRVVYCRRLLPQTYRNGGLFTFGRE